MTVAHVHLLLNHFPTVGFSVGLGLLLLALIRKNEHLLKASFEVFFVMALLTLPAYLSGVAAEGSLEAREGISREAIEMHEDTALMGFVFMMITGLVAWFGLWQSRRVLRPTGRTVGAVLVLGAVTFGLMAQAANIGGDIRHPEIRAAGETAPAMVSISHEAIANFVLDNVWIWPAAETLHFIGLCLLFGIVLVVNLRMLGFVKAVSFASVHRLLPWAMLGFAVNTFTGMLFFIATPTQYTMNVAFYWKVALMLIAGANTLYLTVFDEAWALRPGDEPPMTAKIIAASGIIIWIGVIYAGRMLPFIGNAF
jgi:hypothetical protein